MRLVAFTCAAMCACASAGSPGVNTGDDVAPSDAPKGTDACLDDDGDTICNAVDKCAGHDDRLDMDMDTVANGCDKCPTADDRPDINMNTVPDCFEAVTFMVPLKSVSGNLWRGWHSSAGGHSTTNENTITGESAGAFYNSYFVFTLAGFSASTIQSVTLELQLEMYTSADANEAFSVWDVTTPAANVENTVSDINIYNDLASGVQYANSTATAAQVNTLLSLPLNAMAATHATQKLGQDFVVGVHVDTTPGWIRFGHTGPGATPTTIRLVVKYLP